MRGVSVDPEQRVAEVRGGSLLADLDRAAQAHGLVCPVGVVGHTGVAGLTLGGGMGRLQRRFGLTIDNLLSVEMVDAEGRLVRASDEENADLFWGLRGAGANFGVATTFRFRLHPFAPEVWRTLLVYPIERAAKAWDALGEFAASASDEVMTTMALGLAPSAPPFPPELAGRPVVLVSAVCASTSEWAEVATRPLRATGPLLDLSGRANYLALQGANDETFAWGKRFYMKSGYAAGLSPGLRDACLDAAASAPPRSDGSVSVWSWGGAIARVPEDATAYTGRDAAFWLALETMWEDPADDEEHIGWARRSMAAIDPFTTRGRYVNDLVESGDDVVRAAYGDAKYRRLAELKRRWDPGNVFRLNQNVRPSPAIPRQS